MRVLQDLYFTAVQNLYFKPVTKFCFLLSWGEGSSIEWNTGTVHGHSHWNVICRGIGSDTWENLTAAYTGHSSFSNSTVSKSVIST